MEVREESESERPIGLSAFARRQLSGSFFSSELACLSSLFLQYQSYPIGTPSPHVDGCVDVDSIVSPLPRLWPPSRPVRPHNKKSFSPYNTQLTMSFLSIRHWRDPCLSSFDWISERRPSALTQHVTLPSPASLEIDRLNS